MEALQMVDLSPHPEPTATVSETRDHDETLLQQDI
jgi:hypothetical protein